MAYQFFKKSMNIKIIIFDSNLKPVLNMEQDNCMAYEIGFNMILDTFISTIDFLSSLSVRKGDWIEGL